MSQHYLAFTIGPIYKTMQQTRKTRELWSVSFTFSRLMKHLIDAFKSSGELLSPYIEATMPPLHGAGVYPDRCFVTLEKELTDNEINHIKTNAFAEFIKETGIKEAESYYQVYFVQATFEKNPIQELNKLLDVMELQPKYQPKKLLDWSRQYWANKNTTKSAAYFQRLYKVGYNDDDDILPKLVIDEIDETRRFPSIPEIATQELMRKDYDKYWDSIGYQIIKTRKGDLYFSKLKRSEEQDDEDKIIDALKNAFKEDFTFRHKYFSIVQADGDNVGTLIKAIEAANGSIIEFSKAMYEFAKEASQMLADYGGFPVYIGGDDLLFFAPVANNTINDNFVYVSSEPTTGNIFGNNLFFLLSKLNVLFKAKLEPITSKYKIKNEKTGKEESLPAVSLSFGVMVGYYKQPMSEIQQIAHDLLFYKAKADSSQKNKICMTVQKHSGQSFDVDFQQAGALYDSFMKLTVDSKDKDTNFLNSVMYKIGDQKKIIDFISPDIQRLKYFFNENFNEAVHSNYAPFFDDVIRLISATFAEYSTLDLDTKIEKIYSALRFIHFLNAKDTDE